MKEPREFVVDRAHWRRGGCTPALIDEYGPTELLNEQGYQCCLGFVAEQCGVPKQALLGNAEPSCLDLYDDLEGILVDLEEDTDDEIEDGFRVTNSELTNAAMDINDHMNLTNNERERELIALFDHHGFRLRFEGEYPGRNNASA